MKPSIALLILFLLFNFSSCKEKNNDDPILSNIPKATGFIFTDQWGSTMEVFGDPSNYSSEFSQILDTAVTIVCFPNPCRTILTVEVENAGVSTGKAWVVQADYDNSENPITYEMSNPLDSSNEDTLIQITYTFQSIENPWQALHLDFTELPEGYYRVFFELEDVLLWNDIVRVNDTDSFFSTIYNAPL